MNLPSEVIYKVPGVCGVIRGFRVWLFFSPAVCGPPKYILLFMDVILEITHVVP